MCACSAWVMTNGRSLQPCKAPYVPRLEDDVPLALGPDGALDGGQDLGPADVESVDVRSSDEAERQSRPCWVSQSLATFSGSCLSTSTSLLSLVSSSVVILAEMASSACLTWSVMASLRPTGTMFWAGWSGLSSSSTTQPNSSMAPWVVNTRPTSMSPLLRAEVVRGPPASRALNSLKSSMP